MGYINNGMLVGAQAIYEAQNFSDPSELAFALEAARTRISKGMDSSDILGEIDTDEMLALVKAGDPNAVGRYVLSQMATWVDKLAWYGVTA